MLVDGRGVVSSFVGLVIGKLVFSIVRHLEASWHLGCADKKLGRVEANRCLIGRPTVYSILEHRNMLFLRGCTGQEW